MKGRPSGVATNSLAAATFSHIEGKRRRAVISEKIRGQTGQPPDVAERPSVHLRWGLQQMRVRGWRNDDWGLLLNDDDTLGEGPICILESVQAPMDAPSALEYETPEQFYIRSAFIALDGECPLYLSNWNDEQETFEPVERVLLKAIELAEADEATGVAPYKGLNRKEFQLLFGITDELLLEAQRQGDSTDS